MTVKFHGNDLSKYSGRICIHRDDTGKLTYHIKLFCDLFRKCLTFTSFLRDFIGYFLKIFFDDEDL